MMTSSRKVISEEDYIEKLEEIIEHNYFPHLSTLQTQLDYLQQHEYYSVERLRKTYQQLFPQSSSMLAADKQGDAFQGSNSTNGQLTISQFFDTYISEDNYSFIKLQEKSLQEFRRKYHWMYEPSQLQLTNGDEDAQQLQANRRQLLGELRSASLGIGYSDQPTDKPIPITQQPGMLMLYYLGDKVLTPQERQRMDALLAQRQDTQCAQPDTRSNSFSTMPFTVRNALMFPPEPTTTSKLDGNGTGKVSLLTNTNTNTNTDKAFPVPAPRKKAKIVSNEVVRGPGRAFAEQIESFLRPPVRASEHRASLITPLEAPHTPSTINTDIPTGNNHPFHLLETLPRSTTEEVDEEVAGLTVSATPGEYAPVRMTPSPEPGEGLLASPLMTWGTLAGPPILLFGPVDYPNPNPNPNPSPSPSPSNNNSNSREFAFQLPTPDPREHLARQLHQEKQQHKTQNKKQPHQPQTADDQSVFSHATHHTLATSVSASVSVSQQRKKKLEELTPAAQALARRFLHQQQLKK